MIEQSAEFTPDWVLPPGESIRDLAEERDWTQTALAQRLGYTEKHISQLINGKVPLSVDAAQRLERVLGSTVDFWLALEANYQKHKARLEVAELHSSWVPWLDTLPLKELMASGNITKQRLVPKNKPSLVDECLRFFGVASPNDWEAHYGGMEVDFRRSHTAECDSGATSAWLRLGEMKAEKTSVQKFNKSKFRKALQGILELTCESPEVFEPQMRNLLTEAGVIFVLVPAIPRARVSGVARWLSPTRPLIQLSLYGKSNDRFWFTFFHEAAHILLHAGNQEDKKCIFLDDPNSAYIDDPRENEANQQARDWLIPPLHSPALHSLKSKALVMQFAQEIGVHPGIVVGRLQHDGVIEPSWMNDLKESFSLRSSEA